MCDLGAGLTPEDRALLDAARISLQLERLGAAAPVIMVDRALWRDLLARAGRGEEGGHGA